MDLRHWIVGELALIADRVTNLVLDLVPVERRSGLAEAEDHHLMARLVWSNRHAGGQPPA